MHFILKKRSGKKKKKGHIQLSDKTLVNTQGKFKNGRITLRNSNQKYTLETIKALIFSHF